MEILTGFPMVSMLPALGRTTGRWLSFAARCAVRARGGRCWAVALWLLLDVLLPGSGVRASEFDEYAVKAAYLYNFAKFVEWPSGAFASADAPLSICIAGDNPFGGRVLYGKVIMGGEGRGRSKTLEHCAQAGFI